MKVSHLLCVSILSLIITSCNSNGGGGKRLVVEHDPCHEDNKELKALDSAQRQKFYNIMAPVAHLERAFNLAPKKDDKSAKIPKVQSKIMNDIRELCLINEEGDLGADYQYQTFKGPRLVTSGKGENIVCPVHLEQIVKPDTSKPALADTVTKEVKSHLELLKWNKVSSDYKELGLVQTVQMTGDAKTEWLKNTAEQVNVNEKYNLKIDLASLDKEAPGESLTGEFNVCRKNYTIKDAKYEMVVTRIQLTMDNLPMQGKYLTFTKYEQDLDSMEWKISREHRNDFYLNNVLLAPKEVEALETKRNEETSVKTEVPTPSKDL